MLIIRSLQLIDVIDPQITSCSSIKATQDVLAELSNTFVTLDANPADQVAQIDALVPRVWTVLASLQSYRNQLIPIFKLPPELLSRIMVEYASLTDSLFSLRWTKVMLVCHHWHDVALNSQELWSYVDLERVSLDRSDAFKRIQTNFQRAPSSPQSVQIRFCEEATSMLKTFIAVRPVPDPARLRFLALTGEAHHMQSWFEDVASVAHPLLETLKVLDPSYPEGQAEPSEDVYVPDAFLDGRAPHLSSLTLRGVLLRWGAVENLTELSVTGRHEGTFAELVAALMRCPALQSLDVSVPRRLSELEESPLLPVELPKLQRVSLSGHVDDCSALLSIMAMPGTAVMKIIPLGLWSGAEAREMLIHIRKHFRQERAQVIRSFKMHTGNDSDFLPMVAYADYARHYLYVDGVDSLLFLCAQPANENSRRQILTKVLKALPTTSLTHLDMSDVDAFPLTTWKVPLSLLPSLHFVSIRADATSAVTFFRTLLDHFDDYLLGRGFPSLRHICLDCTHIRGFWKGEERAEAIARGKEALALAFQLLTRVKEAGRPLNVFELHQAWDITESRTTRRLYRLVCEKLINDDRVYDPEWKEKVRKMRLELATELRESGVNVLESEPLSDDSDIS